MVPPCKAALQMSSIKDRKALLIMVLARLIFWSSFMWIKEILGELKLKTLGVTQPVCESNLSKREKPRLPPSRSTRHPRGHLLQNESHHTWISIREIPGRYGLPFRDLRNFSSLPNSTDSSQFPAGRANLWRM